MIGGEGPLGHADEKNRLKAVENSMTGIKA